MPCLLFFSCGDFLRISTGPSHALDPLGSHSLSDSLTAGSLSQEGCSKIRRLSGIEAWTRQGLTRFLVLFFIDLASRRVEIGGVARQANGLWVSQVARNFSDAEEGFLTGKRYLIHDRDPLFTAEFLEILKSSGVQSLQLPPCSPNLNAYAERFVRTIKESCLERIILFGEGSLRKAIQELVEHYHRERNHQGLGNRLIAQEEPQGRSDGAIQCRQRLGGMLNYYYRQAA